MNVNKKAVYTDSSEITLNRWGHFINGAASSFLMISIVQPLSTIKTYFLLREVSFTMTLFGLSEILAERIKRGLPESCAHKDEIANNMGRIVTGALAGAVTTPIDVVKSRMQGDLVYKYPSTWKTVVHLIQNEGPKALFKGMAIRSAFISTAIGLLGLFKDKLPHYFPKFLNQ